MNSMTRWWPVFLRNLLVWRKLAVPSVLGSIAEPLMWLVALGYGIGALVGTVPLGGEGSDQVPYIVFLASGSICSSAMNVASFEAVYASFSRMHVQKTWDSIMNSPVGLRDVLLGEMLWSTYKSLITATAVLGVMFALDVSRSPVLLLTWPILMLAGITFSCMGLIFNALAKGYEFFAYYFTLGLTPMTFISGVFFPRENLPVWLQYLSDALPLAHVLALVRPLFIASLPDQILLHVTVLVVYAALAWYVALVLTRRRFQR